jgi:hypothetical protein
MLFFPNEPIFGWELKSEIKINHYQICFVAATLISQKNAKNTGTVEQSTVHPLFDRKILLLASVTMKNQTNPFG